MTGRYSRPPVEAVPTVEPRKVAVRCPKCGWHYTMVTGCTEFWCGCSHEDSDLGVRMELLS